ncbi:hypothetical protein RR42_m0323 [Cupriavidus basilensis]|uniref:Uncharacterized protein n=1 Tax=Cupriavidus basilensis TaxID=68895 RepID=A0A0C4XYZ5_9BURK|nr:hypothetical protein RR42_m0323 [Cupriavidus basilensis]
MGSARLSARLSALLHIGKIGHCLHHVRCSGWSHDIHGCRSGGGSDLTRERSGWCRRNGLII